MRFAILPVSIFLIACSGGQTTDVETSASELESECDWLVSDGPRVSRGDEVFETDREGIQYPNVDGQGGPDFVAFLGNCGSRADCEFVVATACDNGMHRAVWGPEYAQYVTVEEAASGWGRLVVTQRVGELGCDWPENTIYELRDEAWTAVETCAPGFDRSQWREDCGPGPERVCE